MIKKIGAKIAAPMPDSMAEVATSTGNMNQYRSSQTPRNP